MEAEFGPAALGQIAYVEAHCSPPPVHPVAKVEFNRFPPLVDTIAQLMATPVPPIAKIEAHVMSTPIQPFPGVRSMDAERLFYGPVECVAPEHDENALTSIGQNSFDDGCRPP